MPDLEYVQQEGVRLSPGSLIEARDRWGRPVVLLLTTVEHGSGEVWGMHHDSGRLCRAWIVAADSREAAPVQLARIELARGGAE